MPYFPAFESIYSKTDVECHKCERENCPSRGKYQRIRRDFTYTSGRCPRLPDMRGFVELSEVQNRRAAYPFILANLDADGTVRLSINIPGDGRAARVVYLSRYGYWYYNKAGVKSCIRVDFKDRFDIRDYMKQRGANYINLPCALTDYTL
jgi:hypothetical protein